MKLKNPFIEHYKTRTGLVLMVLSFSYSLFAQQRTDHFIYPLNSKKMKEYMLLIHLPLSYGPDQASALREKWTALTDQWKANGIFVSSFVFPGESYIVAGTNSVTQKDIVSNGLKVVSTIIIRASDFKEAVQLAQNCPILEQEGIVEVREVQPRPETKTWTAEELNNKKIIQNLYEDILNNRKYDLLDSVISPDYIGIGNGDQKGVTSFLETVQAVINAFPDIQWHIIDLMAEGDKVVVRWTWTGTNTGNFRGIPASNNKVTDSAIVIYQLAAGKVINAWLQGDRLGVLMQIGVIPPDLISTNQAQNVTAR